MVWFAVPIIAATAKADITVVDVKETKVYAGRLGHRIFTDVTLRTAEGKTFSVRLDGIKHDRFHPLQPAFKSGDAVKMVNGQPVKK